jgi:hypothetical protein
MSFSLLTQIAPPPKHPAEPGSQKRWEKAQQRLGVALPGDYKTFINRYGTGSFNDLILPYNPFTVNESMNLFQVLDTHHQANRRIQKLVGCEWSVVHPYRLFPEPRGLLPWGATSSIEHVFFWHVQGIPESWTTILYDLRNGEYEVWKLSMICFLQKLFSREIESVLLPKNVSSRNRGFRFRPC